MIKTTLSALAVVLSIGAAHGQSADMSSRVEVKTAIHGSPGTIGAMDAVARSVATGPEDVVLQQAGRATLAEGAHPLLDRSGVEAVGYAPGTVGAAPGQTR